MAKNNLSRDVRGNYQRECGFKISEDGKIRPQRFYLGRDRALAMLANVHLEQCWASVARRWQMYRLTERPVWESCTLKIAMAVARGEPEVTLTVLEDLPYGLEEDREGEVTWVWVVCYGGQRRLLDTDPEEPLRPPSEDVLAWYQELQRDFPWVQLALKNEQAHVDVLALHAKSITPLVENANPGPTGSDTLHKALRAFREWLGSVKYARDGKPKPFGLIAQ